MLGELVSEVTDPLKDFAVDLLLNITDFSWGNMFLFAAYSYLQLQVLF